jgi:hypothetical protein
LVTRKELAVMLNDMAQNPFGINVNINGILILRENIMIHN